jgi:F0F1-type ATP synthase membrane subunit c/vacuolar-type H+-ATPase subunit K
MTRLSSVMAIAMWACGSGHPPSAPPSVPQGLQILGACLPVAFAGWISAIWQGKVSAGGILMTAKRPEMAFKAGVVYAAMVEVYAILGFLASFLILQMGIKLA